MNFLAPPSLIAGIALLAGLAAALLAWAEWRRPDHRRRGGRIAASLLAVIALAFLGLRPGWRARSAADAQAGAEATLVTAGAAASPVIAGRAFALPTSGSSAPAGAVFLPDLVALRRILPRVDTLRIAGDGLEPYDLAALRGLRVFFDPAAAARWPQPVVTALRCPRQLLIGEALEISGRLDGLAPGTTALLTLVAPDGSTEDTPSSPATANGSASFAIRAPAPPAAGRFEWRLRLRQDATLSDEPLGIVVVHPVLPRVLVLESSPRFDTAALRRWFEQAGGTLRARTEIGKNVYRFFGSSPENASVADEFAALNGPLLARYDLVVADSRALLALPEPDCTALRNEVRDAGLGLITLADDALQPTSAGGSSPAARSPAASLLPWVLQPVAPGPDSDPATTENADRAVRLRWPGMSRPMNVPTSASPWIIALQAAQTPLVRDDQGRILAAAAPDGLGRLAVTLVRDTSRWNRTDDPASFAAYWSHLFGEIARPDGASGQWILENGENGLAGVDEPQRLLWQGAASPAPAPALISDESGVGAALPCIQDPAEPTHWRTTFWPRRPGWHRLASSASAQRGPPAPFDFYVAAAGEWAGLTRARRQAATARFAAASQDAATVGTEPLAAFTPIAAGWWFGLFLLSAGGLWVERRLASDVRGTATPAPANA